MPGTLEGAASAISRVISVSRDAEQGFRAAAGSVRAAELRDMFTSYANRHGEFASKLQEAVKALGYEPDLPAGLGGVLFGGWINLKAMIASHDQHAVLTEAARGEDWVLSTFRDAVQQNLPVGIRSIVEAQRAEVEAAHAYLSQRRDASAPKNPNATDRV